MLALIQRVKRASVSVERKEISSIGFGILILLGIEKEDMENDADYLADKIANLRIFPAIGEASSRKNFDLSVLDMKGEILVISQFTLSGDCRYGRRPSFDRSALPDDAERLYNYFVKKFLGYGLAVKTGVFRAMMDVELINDGPVTFILDSKKLKGKSDLSE